MATAILDIDGTLVDTNYHHAIAWFRAFRQHGFVLPLWRIHRHIGMGGDQLVAALAGEGFDREQGDEVRAAEKVLYGELIGEVQPLAGARALIEDLKGVGPHGRPGLLGQARGARALPDAARRALAGRRLDRLRRRRADQARARPRAGGAREGRGATPRTR